MSSSALALLVVLAGATGARAEAPDAALLAWVRSGAAPAFFPQFRKDVPCSPHAADSERFALSADAQALRDEVGAAKVHALAEALAKELARPKAAPLVRAKALFVLPRLQDPSVVPLLVSSAAAGERGERVAAVRGLGFFGTTAAREAFLTYGGRPATVSFDAHPDRAATAALLAATGDPDTWLRTEAWRALSSHQGPEVDGAALAVTPGEDVDVEVVERVAAMDGKAAVPWLLGALERGRGLPFEAAAKGLLAHQEKGPRVTAVLVRALEQGDGAEFHVALETLRGLFGMAGPTAWGSVEERSLLVVLWKERLHARVR